MMYYKKDNEIHCIEVCGERVIWEEKTAHTRYPVARMVWERRKKSFFGTGEVEAQIPNQKAN